MLIGKRQTRTRARHQSLFSIMTGRRNAGSYGPEDLLDEGISVLKHEDCESTADKVGTQLSENGIQKQSGAIIEMTADHSKYAIEPLDYFRSGHYRATVVFSATAIESVLRRKYPKEKTFFDMILHAKRDGLLDTESVSEISMIRAARNSCVHESKNDVTIGEAERVLRAAFSILEKLASYKA